MLSGEYAHTIDRKGRVTLPSKFRDAFADGVVLVRGLDKCVFVYPAAEWPRIEAGLRRLPMTDPRARLVERRMLSGTSDVEIDRAGRIMIPPVLRSHAQLEKDIVIIGLLNRVEIWDKSNWDAYQLEAEKEFEEAAKDFSDLGL